MQTSTGFKAFINIKICDPYFYPLLAKILADFIELEM